MKTAAIIVFPGTLCDRETDEWLKFQNYKTCFINEAQDLTHFDLVVLPGGFSYGDYLRPGAMAASSDMMKDVKLRAQQGGKILGICNGFQILCEAGLLPGVLLENKSGLFICELVQVQDLQSQSELKFVVAHKNGNYFVDDKTLQQMKQNQQIWLRYGRDINGSKENIAGVCNHNGNVWGMMPHPERSYLEWMGSSDGYKFFN